MVVYTNRWMDAYTERCPKIQLEEWTNRQLDGFIN